MNICSGCRVASNMDPLSHYLFVWFIGRKLQIERVYYKVLVLGGLLPDIDALSIVFGIEYAREFHGTVTHSIFVALLLAIALALLLKLIFKVEFWRSSMYAVLGVVSHIFLDIFNVTSFAKYGGRFLWPIYDGSLFLREFIALEYANAVYLTALLLLILGGVYFILKKIYPWSIWLKR